MGRRTLSFLSAACAAIAFAAESTAAQSLPVERAEFSGSGGRETLSVDSPRPLASAIYAWSDRTGQLITYEDPPYIFAGDLQDITESVRKDSYKYYPQDRAPKVLVPLGGKVVVNASSDLGAEGFANGLVSSRVGSGARYGIRRDETYVHVLPHSVRDEAGNWVSTRSILDVLISLPLEDRSDEELLRAVCGAVAVAVGKPVFLGGDFALGGLSAGERRTRLRADNEPARVVLQRALAALDPSKGRFSWALLYQAPVGNSPGSYVLNPFAVPKAAPLEPAAPPRNDTAPRPTDTNPFSGRAPR